MDYSSQVVDPTPAHDYAMYEEGSVGYDRMEETMFYQLQDEAEHDAVTDDEEVPDSATSSCPYVSDCQATQGAEAS